MGCYSEIFSFEIDINDDDNENNDNNLALLQTEDFLGDFKKTVLLGLARTLKFEVS